MFSRKNRFVGWQSLCLILLIILLAACSTGTSSSASPSLTPIAQKTVPATIPTSPTPGITGPTSPGLKNCQPESPLDNSSVGPEVQGTGIHAELWALIQSTSGIPPVVNTAVKIVWRMTGTGDLQLSALGPDGRRISPDWMQVHGGSNWKRPGDEWGSGFTFPIPGCWDLHATRDNASGDVWLKVVIR